MKTIIVETAGGLAPVFHVADEHDHAPGGSTQLGFWLYLMSDCLIFAVLFACYGAYSGSFAGGPGPRALFDLPLVALNTSMLLFSSITYGFAMLSMHRGRSGDARQTLIWLGITALFGACFLGLELYEFSHLIGEGFGPDRSAFLSAFFALVGTHGLHVACGLVWLATLMVQIGLHGLVEANQRRVSCLSMFWHFLDVIWIGVFTFVYLIGMVQ